jgi:hypothetical protein
VILSLSVPLSVAVPSNATQAGTQLNSSFSDTTVTASGSGSGLPGLRVGRRECQCRRWPSVTARRVASLSASAPRQPDSDLRFNLKHNSNLVLLEKIHPGRFGVACIPKPGLRSLRQGREAALSPSRFKHIPQFKFKWSLARPGPEALNIKSARSFYVSWRGLSSASRPCCGLLWNGGNSRPTRMFLLARLWI